MDNQTPETSSVIEPLRQSNPSAIFNPKPNQTLGGVETINSEATAIYITSYPYGGYRCIKRFWLERRGKLTRLVEQTENPKRRRGTTLFWNKPKKSTYREGVVMLYTDDRGHVKEDVMGYHQLVMGSVGSNYDISLIDRFVERRGEKFTAYEDETLANLHKWVEKQNSSSKLKQIVAGGLENVAS